MYNLERSSSLIMNIIMTDLLSLVHYSILAEPVRLSCHDL